MVHLSALFAAALLSRAALSTPAPAPDQNTTDILTNIYGPPSDWHAITLLEAFPDATYKNLPANNSLIYAYLPPTTATSGQHLQAASQLAVKRSITIAKRATSCYQRGGKTFKEPILSARYDFCDRAQAGNAGNGNLFGLFVFYYRGGDGNFREIINADTGKPTSLYMQIRVKAGSVFNHNSCTNSFGQVLVDCISGQQFTRGGSISNFDNFLDVNLDVSE